MRYRDPWISKAPIKSEPHAVIGEVHRNIGDWSAPVSVVSRPKKGIVDKVGEKVAKRRAGEGIGGIVVIGLDPSPRGGSGERGEVQRNAFRMPDDMRMASRLRLALVAQANACEV